MVRNWESDILLGRRKQIVRPGCQGGIWRVQRHKQDGLKLTDRSGENVSGRKGGMAVSVIFPSV